MGNSKRVGAMFLAAALALGLGAATGYAQDKEAAIKHRQDTMKRQGADLKAVQEYAKGEGDQATALAKAEDLLTLAPKIPDLFVPGTSLADFPGKTRAKPEIWQNMDKIKVMPARLESEERKLVELVKAGDRSAIPAQIGVLGKNGCNACHDEFRAPKP